MVWVPTIAAVVIMIGVGLFPPTLGTKRHTDAVQEATSQLGLELLGKDPGTVRAYDFMLFRLQDAFTFKQFLHTGAQLLDVSEGIWDGAPVRTAFLDYRNGKKDYRYAIAIIDVDGSLPRLSVSDERLINKLSKRRGLEETDLGGELLGGRFKVRAEDAGAAHGLLGPDLAVWLMSNGAGYSFETHGGAVAAYKRKGKPKDIASVLQAAKGFRDRIVAQTN